MIMLKKIINNDIGDKLGIALFNNTSFGLNPLLGIIPPHNYYVYTHYRYYFDWLRI